MQIKSILAAAAAVTCTFLVWPAIAADGDKVTTPATTAQTDNAKSAEAPTAKPEEKAMKKTPKPAAAMRVRSGPAGTDRRDARACLNQSNNPAIIKCAEKYRYR